MSSFFPIIEQGSKKFVKLPNKKLFLSDVTFQSLKNLNYIVFIDSIQSYFFFVPEGKPLKGVVPIEIPKTAVNGQEFFEDEYVAFQLQRDKRYHTIEYRQRIANGISTDVTFVPCDLDQLVYNAKYLFGKEKNSASNTAVGFASLKIGELWKEDKSQSKILKKAKEEWYKDDQIVTKISYTSKDLEKDNSLVVESLIYQNFILKMIEKNHTPHCMIPLFSYRCKGFDVKKLKNKENAPVKAWSKLIKGNEYDKTSLNVLILEKGRGSALEKWMLQPHSVQSWMSVLFQIIWTLAVFGQYGLVHNDYHAGNTFLEPLDDPIFGIYFVSATRYFVVPILYFAKIFDFDRSTVDGNLANMKKIALGKFGVNGLRSQSLKTYPTRYFKSSTKGKRFTEKEAKEMKRSSFQKNYRTFDVTFETDNVGIVTKENRIENTFLNGYLCDTIRECNEFNPHADLFYLLWEILHSSTKNIVPPEIRNTIKKIFYGKDELLNKEFGHRGILCQTTKKNGETICRDALFLNSKTQMMDPMTVLESGIFAEYEQQLPLFDPGFTLERDYPHLYIMPSLADAEPRFLDRLETGKIKPISFVQGFRDSKKKKNKK